MLEDAMGGYDYDTVLEKYISSIDDRIKTDQVVLEQRLALCNRCENLIGGTCRLCGCFVKARAAKKIMGCPLLPLKWEAIKQ